MPKVSCLSGTAEERSSSAPLKQIKTHHLGLFARTRAVLRLLESARTILDWSNVRHRNSFQIANMKVDGRSMDRV